MNKLFLEKIFSVKNENTKKVIRLLGLKFSFKSSKLLKIKKLEEENEKLKFEKNCYIQNYTNFLLKLNEVTKINLSTAFLHKEVFPQFKEKHYGQDIVIVATGPSATKYKPLENAIHIGVNRALNLDNINFDYYFIQDYSGKTTEYIEQVNNYRKDKCTKFYGFTSEYDNTTNRIIPENHAHAAKALRYRTAWIDLPHFEPNFAYDISTQPLACFGSVVFPALQFALWTYPKRIYLVGCDCSLSGYAYDKNEKNFLAQDLVLKGYNKFKEFANKYYPDVEIISINPVGLKGLFKDEYQD